MNCISSNRLAAKACLSSGKFCKILSNFFMLIEVIIIAPLVIIFFDTLIFKTSCGGKEKYLRRLFFVFNFTYLWGYYDFRISPFVLLRFSCFVDLLFYDFSCFIEY